MIDPLNLTQIQYELAIAIGTSLNMEQMLKEALGAILHKLGGTAIGVHWMPAQDETGAMAPFTIPPGGSPFGRLCQRCCTPASPWGCGWLVGIG